MDGWDRNKQVDVQKGKISISDANNIIETIILPSYQIH